MLAGQLSYLAVLEMDGWREYYSVLFKYSEYVPCCGLALEQEV